MSLARQGRPGWPALLEAYCGERGVSESRLGLVEEENEVRRRLREVLAERRVAAAGRDRSLLVIPRFFPRHSNAAASRLQVTSLLSAAASGALGAGAPTPPAGAPAGAAAPGAQAAPAASGSLADAQRALCKLAHNRFLQRKSAEMFVEDDLHLIFEQLNMRHSPPFDSEPEAPQEGGADKAPPRSGRINYDDLCAVRDALPPNLRRFFDASTFAKFRRDELGRVSVNLLFRYVCRHVTLYQTRMRLSRFDSHGDGYLRESDLENYVYELIPSLDALVDLQENFYPFYVFTAVRKFFFFLDPKHTCKVAIADLLTSPILHELLDLHNWPSGEEPDAFNWFSAHNTLRVYSQYLELDIDHNGMLSRSEIAGYGTGSLTRALIDRVFEECLTYDGEMDYKTFLDFALAMETKKSPQSLAYFFKLLDINKQGFLDRFTINYLFREIVQRLRELDGDVNGDIVRVDDVTDEIFDMCKPANKSFITLDDLVRCGVGDTIVTMLTDLSGFWAYDNREHLIAEESREARGELAQDDQVLQPAE